MTVAEIHDFPVHRPDLPPAEVKALAVEAWRESGGTLTGAELARRYGRSERWGRQVIAAARDGKPAGKPGTAPASGTAGGTGGTTAAARPGKPGTAAPARATARSTARPGTPRKPGTAAPLPLVVLTGTAVAVVTAVCAVVSYSHIQHLAETAGMGGLSWWLPLGVDGLVVACSCSLIVDRRHDPDSAGHPLAWAGLVIGLAGSLAANVVAVDPTLVPMRVVQWTLAGYGPAALAVSGHLMMRMLGDR